jgi:DNA-binding MarR family transcriptional regulator
MKSQLQANPAAAPFGDLEEFLPYRFAVISHLLTQQASQHYRKAHGLKVHEWRVLTTVGHYPGVSASDICKITLIHRAKVSRILVELEGRGFLRKNLDPADKRTLHLRLSSRGQAIFETVIPRLLRWEKDVLGVLAVRERAELNRLLTKLAGVLRQQAGQDSEQWAEASES